MEKTERVSSAGPAVQRLRVPAGFAFGLFYLVVANPCTSLFTAGLVTAALGLVLRFWAAGHLQKHQLLTVSGPYRWTRNPLYLGSFAIGLGFSLAGGEWWLVLVFLGLFALLYFPVMAAEEGELVSGYGDRAREYIRRTPRFLPLTAGAFPASSQAFSLRRALRNREHHTVLGFLLVLGYLLVKRSFVCG